MRAKFRVHTVATLGQSERVTMGPVYKEWDPETERYSDNENSRFWAATPNGILDMYIDNPEAHGFFRAGADYYLDFTEA